MSAVRFRLQPPLSFIVGRGSKPHIPVELKTLHLYLTRQILIALLMTVAVFTFVLLAGSVLRDVLSLLVQGQASPGLLLKAVGLLIPFVWAFALPMGMLTAALLVFGRFSADNELTAARASGISLVALTTPVVILSLLLSGLCALINMEIGPRSRMAYRSLASQMKAGIADMRFPENRYIKDFSGYIVYIGKNRNQQLQDVMVVTTDEDAITTIRAPRGRISRDEQTGQIIMELFEPKSIMVAGGRALVSISDSYTFRLDTPSKSASTRAPKVSEMTFGQLREELMELEQGIHRSAAAVVSTNSAATETTATAREIERGLREVTSPLRVQMHQQVASSFACFGFALVGVPLAIRVHRRETNIGFALSLVLVFVYYSFMFVVRGLSERSDLYPHLIVWVPNFLFLGVGALLLWRMNRGI